jgi:PAS domain S-box-containing protein
MDEAGHILSLNRSAEALFGFEEISLIGDKFTALFSDETRQKALDYFNGIKENGVATILNDGREVTGLDDGGRKIPLFITLGRVADTPSQKYCAVLRDITTFKQTERELVEAKRKAETASTLKSDFLAKISHEVRTPLSAIIGFAEIMYEERFGPLGTTRYKDYLKDILKSGAHVVNLVNDLLDLSKIEAGRADLDFTTLQTNTIVASSVKLLQNEATRRRVILRQSLASNLPPVIADERSLTQIMLNILSNAIKFTDEGGQVIVSTARTVKGDLVIRVKDTGVGMTEQEVRTALEPFRQIKTSRRTGGTGLGLPLTKALIEANRASMTIISAKDSGTLVEITFPSTRVLTS